MNTVQAVVAVLGSGETTRPRLTHYGAHGRIELSGRVLLNWVSKAMNLLQEEYDVGPGSSVLIDLPPTHWRTAYWALATWQVGACVVVPEPGAAGVPSLDVVVTDADRITPDRAWGGADVVAVTLAPLARRAAVELPGDVLDEAAQLASYADVASAYDEPTDDDPALDTGADDTWSFAAVVPTPDAPTERLLMRDDAPPALALRTLLGVWAGDGSVVVVPHDADAERIAADERVTHRA